MSIGIVEDRYKNKLLGALGFSSQKPERRAIERKRGSGTQAQAHRGPQVFVCHGTTTRRNACNALLRVCFHRENGIQP
jgi:hypothetical protein